MDCSNLHVLQIILPSLPERIRVPDVTQCGRVFATKKQGQHLNLFLFPHFYNVGPFLLIGP